MSRAFVSQSISSTALCIFAALILATSLVSSNRTASGVQQRFSTLEFYWGAQVLPDHALYPILMARDRARLWLVSEEQEPRLRMQFAEHRYQVAVSLAEQEKGELAISTLSKSQIYVLDAVRQIQGQPYAAEDRTALKDAVEHSLYRMELFLSLYPNLDAPILEQLREETSGILRTME